MMKTALITGASSGIGAELARLHAGKGGNLVLVARNEMRLQSLKKELETQHGIKVTILVVDLSVPGSAQSVFEQTEAAGIQVDLLINNAGFGGYGKFHQRELAREEAMMQLNMNTLTSLTHLYVQGMVSRGHGAILNVASTAGFIPGPMQAVYFATKSYVLSFSQAISEELKRSGVTVTALCPGPVNTEFVAQGDLEGVKAFEKTASPESVARCGYRAMEQGKLIAINDKSLRFMLDWVTPFVPRKVLLKASRFALQK